jgi:hypothetical protein
LFVHLLIFSDFYSGITTFIERRDSIHLFGHEDRPIRSAINPKMQGFVTASVSKQVGGPIKQTVISNLETSRASRLPGRAF